MELSYNQLAAGDVLQSFRADDLIEFPVNSVQIVQIANLELQLLRVGPKKPKYSQALSHLVRLHHDSEDVVAPSIGCVG